MHLLFIAVQKVTSKLSSLRRQIIVIKQFRRTRPPRAAEPSAFGSRSLEAAVRLLATVVRRLAWGWRVWFQVHSGGCGRRRHILLCPPGAAPEVAAPSTREMRDARGDADGNGRCAWPVSGGDIRPFRHVLWAAWTNPAQRGGPEAGGGRSGGGVPCSEVKAPHRTAPQGGWAAGPRAARVCRESRRQGRQGEVRGHRVSGTCVCAGALRGL